MNKTAHAVKIGVSRGWREFILGLKSSQDQTFYIVLALLVLGYLYLRRNTDMEGADVTFAQVALPSLLAGLLVFGLVAGPAYALAIEREDGTLLRAKATPRGVLAYTVGQIVLNSVSLFPMLLGVLIPSVILFDGVAPSDASRWVAIVGFIVLGLLATLPIGIIIGSLVPSAQKAGTWGFMPVIALSAVSGIYFPIQALWGWVQALAQMFPMYWLGLGLRSGFLPDEAAVLELEESWRTWEAVGVLSLWAIVGMVLAPRVLTRMAQRQSGSAVQEAREKAAQWVK